MAETSSVFHSGVAQIILVVVAVNQQVALPCVGVPGVVLLVGTKVLDGMEVVLENI